MTSGRNLDLKTLHLKPSQRKNSTRLGLSQIQGPTSAGFHWGCRVEDAQTKRRFRVYDGFWVVGSRVQGVVGLVGNQVLAPGMSRDYSLMVQALRLQCPRVLLLHTWEVLGGGGGGRGPPPLAVCKHNARMMSFKTNQML